MTRIAIAAAVVAISASAATAGTSDRYNDLRFDTSVTQIDYTDSTESTRHVFAVSTRSNDRDTESGSYAYTNRFGVGPYNDSR